LTDTPDQGGEMRAAANRKKLTASEMINKRILYESRLLE
jgi:hypothetical protein